MKRIAAAVLLLAVLLCGCGAQKREVQQKRKICVILKALDSVHWLSVENGLQQAADDLNVSVNILWPTHENDKEAQNVMIRDAIASKPDAIAVAPCNSEDMGMLKRTEEEGILCFYIDTKSNEFDCPYIGSDNRYIGELAAKTLADKVNTGSIAIITGSQQQSSHIERVQGFTEYIEKNTDLDICAVKINPNSADLESMKSMKELMTDYPEVKGVFCTSAMMTMGALQERDRVKGFDDVLLIGVDTQSDALSAVEEGKVLAMIGQSGYEIGYQTIEAIVKALDGEQIEHDIFVDNQAITKENVEEYLEAYLTERGQP